jgi:hypothetical protein
MDRGGAVPLRHATRHRQWVHRVVFRLIALVLVKYLAEQGEIDIAVAFTSV